MAESTKVAVPYPWQRSAWQQLFQQFENSQLPHALLFSGLEGVGKLQIARSLAQLLLCNQPDHNLGCGKCKGCNLFNAETHPDFRQVMPDPGKQIKIEEVRALQSQIYGSAQMSGRKVVLLGPAELLNLNAANALLKTLEEPPGATHLLLFTHQPSGVLPTINSRCQLLKLPIPAREQSIQWLTAMAGDQAADLLEAARGLPVKAFSLLDGELMAAREQVQNLLSELAAGDIGPVGTAQKLNCQPIEQVCHLVIEFVEGRVQASTGAMDGGEAGDDRQQAWLAWQRQTGGLLNFRDKVLALLAKVRSGANPNPQLALESLLIDYQRLS
ncbi:DNA polymerase III subunit delta' [Halioxenophilus aromaticivorans]|uniref:DNA-directed DNA polymerase n=1 Tax=Halioxenophilus aromaticivorans TaxID=1306992 RepID=A0AAV3UAA9_9ALTE